MRITRHRLYRWWGWVTSIHFWHIVRQRMTGWTCRLGVHLWQRWRDGKGILPDYRYCWNCCKYQDKGDRHWRPDLKTPAGRIVPSYDIIDDLRFYTVHPSDGRAMKTFDDWAKAEDYLTASA